MSDLFIHPAIQSGAVPFTLSLCLAAILGFLSTTSARFSGLAVCVGFLGAYVLTFGLPPAWPVASGQKIAFIAILGAVGGCVSVRERTIPALALSLAVIFFATAWLGWRKLAAEPSLAHLYELLIIAGGAIALVASRDAPTTDELNRTVPLLISAFAFSAIAFIGASASIMQNAAAVGAALGGVMLLNWPTRRFGLGATARITGVVILTALAAQMAFFTQAPAWPLALLLPALFADRLVDKWIGQDTPKALIFKPVLTAFVATVPAMLAVGATWSVVSSSAIPGGY